MLTNKNTKKNDEKIVGKNKIENLDEFYACQIKMKPYGLSKQ